MKTTRTATRTVLATAAAAALVLGAASGALATGRPATKPAPQGNHAPLSNDRLQSVSITNHRTIDLAKVGPTSSITLRAKVWDPTRDSRDRTVRLYVDLYTKKVNGQQFQLVGGGDAPASAVTQLALRVGDEGKKVKHYSAPALLSLLWTPAELAAVDAALDPGEKAYLCLSSAEVNPGVDRFSTQVRKRLGVTAEGTPVAKPVRDCVKVIDSVDAPVPTP